MATAPNFQKPPVGLGSYLTGIVPEDVAVSAGAFAFSMQQVKNINNVDFEKFSQVVASLEMTTANLPLINGTDVPVDKTKAEEGSAMLQTGSGPYGTYTTSDFFGCMSGLPYSWKELQETITQAQTTKLTNIYNQLFLAVTWEEAVLTVEYTTNVGPTYTITGITITDAGGGYGRAGAPAPTIVINGGSGATAVCTIGTDPSNAGSNGNGTYGRITSVRLTSAGITTATIPTVTIECPPTATLPVQANGNVATGGVNTAPGTTPWPSPMNAVVDAYITQANLEILNISQSKRDITNQLNAIYNQHGSQLKIEQSSRYLALAPVPLPDRNKTLSQYPISITSFVDSVGSTYAQLTKPHMFAQTLEAISDLSNVTGQSLVGLMRQERNRSRLDTLPIPLDNQVPDSVEDLCCVLTSNGTTPTAKPNTGISVTGINGNVANPTTTFTAPATLVQSLGDQQTLSPKPKGFYDPNNNRFVQTTKTTSSSPIKNILNLQNTNPNKNVNLLGPNNNGTGPAIPILSSVVDPASLQSGTNSKTAIQVINTQPILVVTAGENKPTGDGQIMDDGSPTFPGSLAGSPATNMLPCELNTAYTSSSLLPSTLTPEEAINEVIKCNCDCWVN